MRQIIDNPRASLVAGAGDLPPCCCSSGSSPSAPTACGSVSFLVRLLHVLAAMVWVGLVVFVNFVQLVALQGPTIRRAASLHKAVVPAGRLVVPARLDR